MCSYSFNHCTTIHQTHIFVQSFEKAKSLMSCKKSSCPITMSTDPKIKVRSCVLLPFYFYLSPSNNPIKEAQSLLLPFAFPFPNMIYFTDIQNGYAISL